MRWGSPNRHYQHTASDCRHEQQRPNASEQHPCSPMCRLAPEPHVPPLLAAAQSAGILTAVAYRPDLYSNDIVDAYVIITFKKHDAWDKKSGLCVGHRVVDKIDNWMKPVNNETRVNFHWKIDPAGWATIANLKANGVQTEGDAVASFLLMNNGWQLEMMADSQ